MKKKFFALVFMIGIGCAFGEVPPLEGLGWHWNNGYTTHGKTFYNVDEAYREQEGWAVIQNHSLRYWLYDPDTYMDGNTQQFYDKFVPIWLEDMGLVVDYNFSSFDTYSAAKCPIAASVQDLMKRRGRRLCVQLAFPLACIYEASADWAEWKIYTMFLREQEYY